jgi:hypothetical protein
LLPFGIDPLLLLTPVGLMVAAVEMKCNLSNIAYHVGMIGLKSHSAIAKSDPNRSPLVAWRGGIVSACGVMYREIESQ